MKKTIENKVKWITWFLIVALIFEVVGFISLVQVSKIAKPLSQDIPRGLDEIKSSSHLNSLAQFIRYYDEVLTMSARNYAFTSDVKWKDRYNSVVPQLDEIIKEAIQRGDEKDKEFFSSVDVANLALVEMEERSIELVDQGRESEAIAILESEEYWKQKGIYKQGLVDYVSRKGSNYDDTINVSTELIEAASDSTKELIKTNERIILWLIVAGIIVDVFLILLLVKYWRKIKRK